ncbi:MAG: hypothetical protein QM490_04815 [Candidatus Gracilibacteria bacterium]
MKFSKKLMLAFLASTLCSFSGVFASGLDHFEVQFDPNQVKVNESLDLTIEAVDKNNARIRDYEGRILIFSLSDPEAELPSTIEENTYTFSAADQGKVKFENGVKFKSVGLQNIHIYDLEDDTIFGIAEAEISAEEVLANIDIFIVSPDNGLTIGNDSILVSGTTQKNYQVKIIVNGKEELLTTSNNDGIFEKKVENLEDGTTSFQAQIIDADGNVVGESNEVSVKVELSNLNIKNVKLTPESLDTGDSFEIKVTANPGLSKVNAIIDDVLIELEETLDGVYVTKAVAPSKADVYGVDINLQDLLGHKKIELGAASLTVNEIKYNAAGPAEEPFTPKNNNGGNGDDKVYRDLRITGLKLVELKTKSILTWDELENIEGYNVYKKLDGGGLELIENVKTAKFEVEIVGDDIKYDYFAIKAVAKTSEGEIFEGTLSDATKIQTGPEIIILIILSLLIGGFLIMRKQKSA